MKFSVARSRLLDALQTVQNVVSGKSTMQILQNALICAKGNRITVTTTDLDLSESSAIDLAGEVESAGEVTLPVKKLSSAVRELAEDTVTFDIDGNDIARVKCGTTSFKISGLPARDFPPVPAAEGDFHYTLERAHLRDMLRKTAYAVSQDETRRALNGVLLSFKDGKLVVVATDGRRLALVERDVDFPAGEEHDFILPVKAVNELQRVLDGEGDVRIFPKQSQLVFSWDQNLLASKLIDATYPNYAMVIPQNCEEKAVIDREAFLTAIRRASVMANDRASGIRFDFAPNQLKVYSVENETGTGSDSLPIKYAGKEISLLLNPDYLSEPLRVLDDDEVSFEMSEGSKPTLLKCGEPFLHVLMPLRS